MLAEVYSSLKSSKGLSYANAVTYFSRFLKLAFLMSNVYSAAQLTADNVTTLTIWTKTKGNSLFLISID